MPGIREVLQFLIEADAKQAIRTFDDVERASAKSLGKAESSTQKLSAGLTKFGAAAVAASAVAGVGLYKLASGASNLELSQRRLQNIFGDSGQTMVDFAKGLNDIGLSDQAATAAMASIGEAARGLGLSADDAARLTPQLVKIVTQLGYLQGMQPGEALETVNAAMRGEYDSLQRLVPAINQAAINQKAMQDNGVKNAQSLTAQQKTMAALELIVSKGSATLARSGDVMDTVAGRAAVTKANLADLGTAIGSGALPVVKELSSWVGAAAGAFNAMPTGVQTAAGRIAAFTVVGTAAIGTISLIAGEAIKLKDTFDKLSAARPNLMAGLGTAAQVAGIAVAVATVGAAIGSLDDNGRMSKESIDALTVSLGKLDATASATDISKALPAGTVGVAKDLQSTFDTLSDPSWAQNIGQGFENIASSVLTFGTVDTAAEKARNRLDGIDKALASLAGTNLPLAQTLFIKLKKSLEDQGVSASEIRKRFDDYNNVVETNTSLQQENTKAHSANGLAMASAAGAVTTTEDALKAMNDTAERSKGMLDLAAQGATAFADAIERTTAADDQIAGGLAIGKASADFKETVKDLPGTIDSVKLALGGYNEAQTTAINNLSSLSDQTSSYLQTLLTSGATTAQVQTSANNLATAYANQMRAAGLTEDQVQSYLQVLGLTPKQINTAITTSGTEVARQKLALLQSDIDALPKDVHAKVTQDIIKGDYAGALAEINAYYSRNPAQLPVNVVLQSQSVERARRFGYTPAPGGYGFTPGARGLRGAAPGYVPMPSTVNVFLPPGSSPEQTVAAIRKYEKRNGSARAGWHPL